MHINIYNIYTQTKDTHRYKVNVNILNQLISLHNRDGEIKRIRKDQNHNARQAEESKKKIRLQKTTHSTASQQQYLLRIKGRRGGGVERMGPLRLSFPFRSCGLWTLSCDFVLHNYETLKWLSSLPILMQKSCWW